LTGTMKSLIAGVTVHASQRAQFGRKLKEFGVIRAKIAAMESRIYAAESLAYLVAANMDRGASDYQIEAAVSKVFASEAVWFVADEALQIMGGLGFMKAMPYERVVRGEVAISPTALALSSPHPAPLCQPHRASQTRASSASSRAPTRSCGR